MRVIVCGAAGFIGSHLSEHLLQAGYEVLGVDSQLTGSRHQNLAHLMDCQGFTFRHQDISESLECAGPVEAILHLASPASPKDFGSLGLDILRAHSVGMWNLLELARTKEARFLYASSSEIYGDPEMHPQTEDYHGNVDPVGERSCYDEGKRFGEALVMAYYRKYGMSTRIARIFNTYGPRMRLDDGRAIPNFVVNALKGKPLLIYGDGKQTRSPCYVSDTVRGLHLLLESDEVRPVNIGNPDEWSMLDLAQFINSALGNEAGLVFAPPLHADDPHRRCPDIQRARTSLNWEPQVTVADGIGHMADWMRTTMGMARNATS